MLALFAPTIAAAREDARQLLVWYPLARTGRRLFPDAFAALDRAVGAGFPFAKHDVDEAHARWTAEWLAWEGRHDAEYKLKAAVLEQDLLRRDESQSAVGRARLEAIERETLERYQRRYEEYVRTAKALAALEREAADRP